MSSKPKRILVVEDEMILAMNLKLSLEEAGYIVSIAIDGEEAIGRAEKEKPDIVLMDITLSTEPDGIEATRKIMEISDIPIIYLTGNTDERTIERAKQTNPRGILLKPVEDYELKKALEEA